jgi:hypothetical protein
MNIKEAIALIVLVEKAYPNRTTSQIVDTLRFYGGYDTSIWKAILGTTREITYGLEPGNGLTTAHITSIQSMLFHNHDDKYEYGVVFDMSNKRVALGHVICGISAAIYRPTPIYCNNVIVDPQTRETQYVCYANETGLGRGLARIDPLYAATLAGDIGQAATAPDFYLCSQYTKQNYRQWKYGGISNGASDAELIGDIDGFMLGYWISTNKPIANPPDVKKSYRSRMLNLTQLSGTVKLSEMLSKYYGLVSTNEMIAGSGFALDVNRRFANFKTTYDFLNSRPETKDIFLTQSRRFNRVFAVSNYPKNNQYTTTRGSSWPDGDQTRRAQEDFQTWLNNWIQKNNSYDFYNYPPVSLYEEGSDLALEYFDGIENFGYEMTIVNIDPSSGEEEVQLKYTFNSIEGNYLTNPDAETIALIDGDSNI